MMKRFVLAADTDIGLRSGLSANVAGTFFNVHSLSAKLDGIFIVARNIFALCGLIVAVVAAGWLWLISIILFHNF